MAGVTDMTFRKICKEQGADLIYSEMVSAKGIHYNSTNTKELLEVAEEERPVALQLFGSEPSIMAEAAIKIEHMNFDIFDINMGCPVPKVVNNGEGSALMKTPELASKIVKEICRYVKKPVTVKIRKGFTADTINAVEFAKMMEDSGAAAIAVHGRTREQYYSGKADWDIIRQVKRAVSVPVIGNGDIFCPEDAVRMIEYTGCDAVMIARGAQGNPWIFKAVKERLNAVHPTVTSSATGRTELMKNTGYDGKATDGAIGKTQGLMNGKPGFEDVFKMIQRHFEMLMEVKDELSAVREMRKHVAWYTEGFPYSAKLRNEVNLCDRYSDVLALLQEYAERLIQPALP